jgi:hypothetical protein
MRIGTTCRGQAIGRYRLQQLDKRAFPSFFCFLYKDEKPKKMEINSARNFFNPGLSLRSGTPSAWPGRHAANVGLSIWKLFNFDTNCAENGVRITIT